MDSEKKVYNYQVVVIGAGAAGIGAAVKLQKQNVPYIMLEARNRIGGRVLTKNLDGINVDLGASWIHSYSKKNPLHKFVKQLKVPQTALTKCQSARILVDGQQGGQFNENTLEVSCINSNYVQRLAKVNASKFQKDVSIFEAVSTYYEQNINKSPPKQKRCTELLLNMIQHYEASTLKQLSANYYQFRIDEGENFLPEGGYGSLIMRIAEENKLCVQFQKIVERVTYDEVKAEIHCRDGSIYTCKKVISSLPLGVLKAKKVKFVPQLPLQYSNSIQRLGLGLMNKIIIAFEQNFWGSSHWVLIGSQERGKFSHFYNLSQKGKNILCCFITDDFARKTENYSDEEIISELLNFQENLLKYKIQK